MNNIINIVEPMLSILVAFVAVVIYLIASNKK
jgi:hypothetical protein